MIAPQNPKTPICIESINNNLKLKLYLNYNNKEGSKSISTHE
jgi:hypothetical protein